MKSLGFSVIFCALPSVTRALYRFGVAGSCGCSCCGVDQCINISKGDRNIHMHNGDRSIRMQYPLFAPLETNASPVLVAAGVRLL